MSTFDAAFHATFNAAIGQIKGKQSSYNYSALKRPAEKQPPRWEQGSARYLAHFH